MAESFESIEAYKEHKRIKHEEMLMKQEQPYAVKVDMAKARIRMWVNECRMRKYNMHVSVGGLDSITLCTLIRSMGYDADDIPAVSASMLEDKSIQAVHKELGYIVVQPLKPKVRVLQEEGFPVLSKKLRIRSRRSHIRPSGTKQSDTRSLPASVESSDTMRQTPRCVSHRST